MTTRKREYTTNDRQGWIVVLSVDDKLGALRQDTRAKVSLQLAVKRPATVFKTENTAHDRYAAYRRMNPGKFINGVVVPIAEREVNRSTK